MLGSRHRQVAARFCPILSSSSHHVIATTTSGLLQGDPAMRAPKAQRTFHTTAFHSSQATQDFDMTAVIARRMLKLELQEILTAKILRSAYLETAKQCHPDVMANQRKNNKSTATLDFRRVTEAYEFLLENHVRHTGEFSSIDDDGIDFGVSLEEEANYRRACQEWLGLTAETVEESKRCPLFRKWLMGNTDSAQVWKNFFALHGGLAPCLSTQRTILPPPSTKFSSGVSARRRKR